MKVKVRHIKELAIAVPKSILFILLYCAWGLSYLYPRNKRIWVFDSWRGKRFSDNTKYLFLYVTKHHKDITAVWLTKSDEVLRSLREKGYKAHHSNSFLGSLYTLRAKILFFDSHPFSINVWLSGGLITINLWHGLPFKKVLYDSINTKEHNWVYSSKGLKRLWYKFFNPRHFIVGDYTLATSSLWVPKFASAWKLPESKVIKASYPRDGALFEENTDFEIGTDLTTLSFIKDLRSKGERIVFYMPTFRDGQENPLLTSSLNFSELNEFFKDKHAYFFLKLHHEKSLTLENLSHVHLMDAQSDPTYMLKFADILITDYSSVFFDFLLLDRPMLFFPYDLEVYTSNHREIYFDYDLYTPGPKAYSVAELKAHLEELLSGKDEHKDERKRVQKAMYEVADGREGSQDIVKFAFKLLGL